MIAAEEEEKEAVRIQKERAEQLDEDDFGMANMISKSKKKNKKKKKNKATQEEAVDESKLSQKERKKLARQRKKEAKRKASERDQEDSSDDDDDAAGADKIERVAKDLAALSKDEKMEILVTESPELLGLMEVKACLLMLWKTMTCNARAT